MTLAADYPLLYEMAKQQDVDERLGRASSALEVEAAMAMLELWNARRSADTEPLATPSSSPSGSPVVSGEET